MLIWGRDCPRDVPEQCNRDVAGKAEAKRGKGPWPNLVSGHGWEALVVLTLASQNCARGILENQNSDIARYEYV